MVTRAIYIACFCVGAFSHARDFASSGWRPYAASPAILEVYWTSLLFLDLLVVALLLLRSMRVGLLLAISVMITDVAANAYASFWLGIPGFDTGLPLQAAFLGFILGSAPFLWPGRSMSA
jgi:hypothetical protein